MAKGKSTRISKVANYEAAMPDSVTEMTTTTDTHSYGGRPIGSARAAFPPISGRMIRHVGPHPEGPILRPPFNDEEYAGRHFNWEYNG